VIAPGLPYHITQRGTNRERVFYTAGDRLLYLQLVRENQADDGVRVLAYCLMTNHVHFGAVPEREDSLALLFGRANGRYAQALNIRKGRSGHLWQARFHSCVLADTHLGIALLYVEDNPCRAGMVQTPAEYRWSSSAVHLLGVRIAAKFSIWVFGNERVGRPLGRKCTRAWVPRSRSSRCENAHTRVGRAGRNPLWPKWRSDFRGDGVEARVR
jgi:putative transposase